MACCVDGTTTCQCCECVEHCPSIGLDDWFRIMQQNPYYSFQMGQDEFVYPGTPIAYKMNTICEALVFCSLAQGGTVVGRDQVWDAIGEADKKFRNFTGYWPAPTFDCDEWDFKKAYTCGRIRLRNAKVISLGMETIDSIATVDIDPNIHITDENGDTLLDTVTIIVPVVEDVPASELVVYLPEDAWRDSSSCIDEQCKAWIRPIKVKTVGDNWQITFPSWLAVKPERYAGYAQVALDPADLTIYATQVEVKRRWADPTKAITVMRRNISCDCAQSGECYTCAAPSACIINGRNGLITINMHELGCCMRCVQRVCIHYLSGDCDNETLIARLAAADLGRDVCCVRKESEVSYWFEDFVGTDRYGRISTALTPTQLNNPFGTKRGQLDAYRALRWRRHLKAIRI